MGYCTAITLSDYNDRTTDCRYRRTDACRCLRNSGTFTVGTLPFACPFTVAVRFEFVVPDVDEFIFVDIPLMEIGTNARTTGNGTVCQHRSRTDSGIALEDGVAHFGFVVSEEPFATVAGVYLSFLPAVADEVEHPGELFVGQLQVGFFGGRPTGKMVSRRHRLPPISVRNSLKSFRSLKFFLVYASHHIPDNLFLFRQHADGVDCILETFG